MGYSGFKGIGPNKIGQTKELVLALQLSKLAKPQRQRNLPKQIVDAIAAKSPAKKNKGMSYDIKEASNQKLSASARKHYAENAQAANKSGYKG